MHIHRPRVCRFKPAPFVPNGRLSLLSCCRCTGQNPQHRTNVRCVSPREGSSDRALACTGQRLTGQSHCPVLCPVRSAPHRSARVSHRTNGACHRACPVHPWHVCPVLHSSLSRSRQLKPRAPEHRTQATGQNLLSGALSGASPRSVSTPFLNAFSFYLPNTMCISNVHVC